MEMGVGSKERERAGKPVRWIRWTVAAGILACAALAAISAGETIMRALVRHRPLRYDQPFAPAIERADRVVVRADGFDCCGPVDETKRLFEVDDPAEVENLRRHLKFEPRTTTNSLLEACMCCGGPGIDWYRNGRRIALTAMQHGHSIRWKGFSTARMLGMQIGYGDGPLTRESREWLAGWFQKHGVGGQPEKADLEAEETTGAGAGEGGGGSARRESADAADDDLRGTEEGGDGLAGK